MSKKIYDILPPKLANKVEDTIKVLDGATKPKRQRRKKVEKPLSVQAPALDKAVKKEKRFPVTELLVGCGIIVLLLCAYGFMKLPKADIEIWPKVNALTLSEKITADTKVTTPDLAHNIIPAHYVEVESSDSQAFEATGSASNDGKATGAITVYNKISPATPFTLIKGTHFLSDSGKYFVTAAKVTIPQGQKNAPGSVLVQVLAQDSGSDYNIGASKFSIPKLNGTSYYYSLYGASTSAMAGGYTGKVKKVTDDNIQGAKDIIAKKVLAKAQDALKSKLAPGDILLDGAMQSSVVGTSADVKADTIADNFNEQATVKVSALVFKKQDLDAFVKNDIAKNVSNDKKVLEKSLQVSDVLQTPGVQNGALGINVTISAKTYADINTGDLIDLFSMKSSDQIKQIVDQMYGGSISELKINFWPFWVKKAPDNKSRITVNLRFE